MEPAKERRRRYSSDRDELSYRRQTGRRDGLEHRTTSTSSNTSGGDPENDVRFTIGLNDSWTLPSNREDFANDVTVQQFPKGTHLRTGEVVGPPLGHSLSTIAPTPYSLSGRNRDNVIRRSSSPPTYSEEELQIKYRKVEEVAPPFQVATDSDDVARTAGMAAIYPATPRRHEAPDDVKPHDRSSQRVHQASQTVVQDPHMLVPPRDEVKSSFSKIYDGHPWDADRASSNGSEDEPYGTRGPRAGSPTLKTPAFFPLTPHFDEDSATAPIISEAGEDSRRTRRSFNHVLDVERSSGSKGRSVPVSHEGIPSRAKDRATSDRPLPVRFAEGSQLAKPISSSNRGVGTDDFPAKNRAGPRMRGTVWQDGSQRPVGTFAPEDSSSLTGRTDDGPTASVHDSSEVTDRTISLRRVQTTLNKAVQVNILQPDKRLIACTVLSGILTVALVAVILFAVLSR